MSRRSDRTPGKRIAESGLPVADTNASPLAPPAAFEELLARIRGLAPDARRVGVASCLEPAQSEPLHSALERAAASQALAIEFVAVRETGPSAAAPLDGVLLIVASGKTEASELRQRVAALRRQGQRILGILLFEEGTVKRGRPTRLGGRLTGRGLRRGTRPSTHAATHAPPRLLDPVALADEAERLRRNAVRHEELFAALAIYRTDSRAEISAVVLRRLLACREEHHGRIGRLANGGLGILLPGAAPHCAAEIAADLLGVLERLEPAARWLIQILHHDEAGPQQPPEAIASSSGISTGNALEGLFAYPLPRWKRGFDVVVAAAGLLAGFPLLVLTGVLIKATSRGPVLFRQWRSGHGGRPFEMLKFRSMVDGAERMQSKLAEANEQDGPAFKIRRDPRVTRLGRFLRRTCIDELPQLWNVLRGEMSLVGPRPLPLREQAGCRAEHQPRLRVHPGLTCFWQARGRELTSFDEWMQLDLQYVRRRSLVGDLGILLATTRVVLPLPAWPRGRATAAGTPPERATGEAWGPPTDHRAGTRDGKAYAKT